MANGFIWEVLATNQSEFKILLDAVINRNVLPVHIELLEKHDNHVRIDHRWINVPGEYYHLIALILAYSLMSVCEYRTPLMAFTGR